MARHLAANALTFLIVALFLVGGVVAWGASRWSAPGPLAEAICLQVPPNSSFGAVTDDLAQRGAIASPTVFRIGVDYTDRRGLLKAGSFLVPARASMEEIVDLVTGSGASTCGNEIVYVVGVNGAEARVRELDAASGDFEVTAEYAFADPEAEIPPDYARVAEAPDTTFRVIVVEGTTAWQVVQALNALPLLEGDVADIPPEGSLAPSDYAFAPGDAVAPLLEQMRALQTRRLAEAWARRDPDLPFDTPEEALTLASIVEKETAVAEERPVVASVLVNRIRDGMRLQFDPTIIYGITRGQGPLDRPIRQSDIEGATERELHGEVAYNTYVVDGLPAGPIANPGAAALEAAVQPSESDFLYFVADGTGGHAFAATLDEHNANVARWRELEAERLAAEEAAAETSDGG